MLEAQQLLARGQQRRKHGDGRRLHLGRARVRGHGVHQRVQQVARARKTIGTAADRLEGATDVCERLELLLDRLEPWKELLCEAELDESGLPRRATQLVETLRTGLGADMNDLAETLNGVARRITALGLPVPEKASAVTETKPESKKDGPPEITTTVEVDGNKKDRPMRFRTKK